MPTPAPRAAHASGGTTAGGSWIRRFHESPDAAVRLVCFPHAGGSAGYYYPLSQGLAPAAEVLAVQYPGRQDRRNEPFAGGVGELADRAVEAVEPWLDRPYALYGHSMGAVVAYEVARRLGASRAPLLLAVSGRRAPSRHRDGRVHLADDAGLVAELRRMGGTDQRFLGDRELLEAILPVIRADYRAIETYVWTPGPPLTCPVTVLVGDSDPQTTLAEARAWAEHTTGDFEIEVFAGGHFFLEQHKGKVTADLSAALRRVVDANAKEGTA